MSLIVDPEAYSAPPVETWRMPSDPASAKPRMAAVTVWLEVTLMAGYANERSLGRSRMAAETSGVAMGAGISSAGWWCAVRPAPSTDGGTGTRGVRYPTSGVTAGSRIHGRGAQTACIPRATRIGRDAAVVSTRAYGTPRSRAARARWLTSAR